jgi:hypothetical protein
MKKKIFYLISIVVCYLGLVGPLFGWWSGRRNNHYQITWLSRNALRQMSLFHPNELRRGANAPDGISGLGKVVQHHRHAHRTLQNFNATVSHLRLKNNRGAAHTIASAFHYVQDALDLSVHFRGAYVEWVRYACYSILANWNWVGQNRNFQFTYNQTYKTEWAAMKNLNVKGVVRRVQQWSPIIARELGIFRNYLRPGPNGYLIQQNATRPFLKALAILQAAQDRILRILQDELSDTGLSDVTVNSIRITISVWDHATEDGDLVQVSLNGQVMWPQIRLSKGKTNLQLPIRPGNNLLEIKALNEGSQKPNTASIQISHVTRGKHQQQWKLKTGQTGRIRIFAQGYTPRWDLP